MGINARMVYGTVLLISSLFLSLRPATSQIPVPQIPGISASPAESPSSSPPSTSTPPSSSSPTPSFSFPNPFNFPPLSLPFFPASPSASPSPSPSPSPSTSLSSDVNCSTIWTYVSRSCEPYISGNNRTSSDAGGSCCLGVQLANERLCLCDSPPPDSPSLDEVSYVAENVCGVVPEALKVPGSSSCGGSAAQVTAPTPAPEISASMAPSPNVDTSPDTGRVSDSASSGSQRSIVSMSVFSYAFCSIMTVAVISNFF